MLAPGGAGQITGKRIDGVPTINPLAQLFEQLCVEAMKRFAMMANQFISNKTIGKSSSTEQAKRYSDYFLRGRFSKFL